jgi:hypothetical protein
VEREVRGTLCFGGGARDSAVVRVIRRGGGNEWWCAIVAPTARGWIYWVRVTREDLGALTSEDTSDATGLTAAMADEAEWVAEDATFQERDARTPTWEEREDSWRVAVQTA